MSRITIYSKKEVARVDFNPLDSSIAYIIESESNDKWVVYMFKSVIDGSVILNTKITSGKNIPFGRAEVIISKTIFASDESFGVWTVENPKPILKAGVTLIDIETFGTATKYLVTNVKMDESLVVISASHPSYKLTYTNVDDVFNKMFKVKRVYEDSYSGVTEVKKPLWALFATGTNFNSKYKEIIFKKSDDTFVRFVNKGTNYTLKATEYRVIVESGDAIISSDQRMASINKGCQKQYVSGGFNLTYGPEYNISTNTTSNISKYASGVGFEGDYGVVDADCPAFDKFTFWYSADEIDIIFHIATVEISEAGGRSSKVEWIEGRADDIIRFLIKYALDYPVYPQYFTRATTYYPNPGDLGSKVTDAIKNEYSTRELVDAVTRGPVLIDSSNEEFLICVEEDTTSEVYSPYYGTPIGEAATIIASTERIRMRVNGVLSCGTLLANIAKATNRKFSFSDEGFFMTGDEKYYTAVKYSKGANDEISASITVLQPINGVLLDTDSYSEEEFIDGLQTHTIKSERVVNIPVVVDNGAESIIGSQQVEAENYKVTVENSSDDSNPKGKTIEFPLADSRGGKKYRDAMAKICAYNVLVNEYQVKDNVLYDTSEVRDSASSFHGEEKYGRKHFISLYELEQYSLIKLPPNGSFALVMPSMVEVEYVYTGGQWVISIPDDEATSEEINAPPKYEIYSVSKKVKDNYNEVVINNAPLIQVSRSYPGYVTQFMWGKGVTVNTITKTKELHESSIFDKSSANEDTRISEKNSAMLIMGNQTPNELNSNNNSMFGYTGLTIGKDVGSDIYGMKGYNKGVLQAEFNSQGKISAGGGTVILDAEGINISGTIKISGESIDAGRVSIDNTGVYVTDLDDPDNNIVSMNGSGFTVGHGEGKVTMDLQGVHAGEVTLNSLGVQAGQVKLNSTGLAVTDHVYIDETGFYSEGQKITINGGGLQVGSHVEMDGDGVTAGNTLLDSAGFHIVKTFRAAGVSQVDHVLMNKNGLIIGPISPSVGKVIVNRDGLTAGSVKVNDAGIYVADKVYMNTEGFTVGVGTGKVTMDGAGVKAGNTLLDSNGFHVLANKDVAPTVTGNTLVTMNDLGFTVSSNTSLDANLDTRAVKFRLDASDTDVARIYAGRGGVGAATKNVLNIQSYNAGANKGLLRIYNKYVDNDNTYEFKSLKTMDGNMSILSSTETTDFSPILEHTNAIVSIVGIETGRIVNFKMIFSGVNGFVGAVDTKQSIKWLLKRQPHLDCVVMRNGNEEVDIPAATGKFQVIEIPMDHKNTKSLEFNFTHNRPLEYHSLSFANFTFNDESDSGGTIEIDENYINLNGTVKINGLLDGGLTLGSETVQSLVDASIVAIAERLFPVGYIYTTLYNDNPGNRFGGVWVPYAEGRTLVGLDINDSQFNKAGYGGGTKTHTLTTAQMPSHTHTAGTTELRGTFTGGRGAAATGVFADDGNDGAQDGNKYPQKKIKMDADHTHTVSSAGSGSAHNNLQPYVTVYMFLRVS